MDSFLQIIKGPEFWMSFAFVAVILIAARPLGRFLSRWGAQQADKVRAHLDEPANLRKQAEELYEKYVLHTKNQEKERANILKQADIEIENLRKDFEEHTAERMQRKDREVAARLKMVQENGTRQMKEQMAKLVIEKTYDILHERESDDTKRREMDKSIALLFDSLKKNTHLLKND